VKPKRCGGNGLSDGSYLATVRKKERIPAGGGEKRNRYRNVELTVRIIDYQIPGFRPARLLTTILDPAISARELVIHYHRRWDIELDLRNIKTTLGMEHLRCKTPEMAVKELWVYLLAYNLIRLLMAQAALLADQIPRQLSFKHTVQIWMAWQQRGGGTHDGVSIHALLILIAEPRVGLRPGRIEPRALKRRPKPFPLLTKPRKAAREEVRKNGHPKKQR